MIDDDIINKLTNLNRPIWVKLYRRMTHIIIGAYYLENNINGKTLKAYYAEYYNCTL